MSYIRHGKKKRVRGVEKDDAGRSAAAMNIYHQDYKFAPPKPGRYQLDSKGTNRILSYIRYLIWTCSIWGIFQDPAILPPDWDLLADDVNILISLQVGGAASSYLTHPTAVWCLKNWLTSGRTLTQRRTTRYKDNTVQSTYSLHSSTLKVEHRTCKFVELSYYESCDPIAFQYSMSYC